MSDLDERLRALAEEYGEVQVRAARETRVKAGDGLYRCFACGCWLEEHERVMCDPCSGRVAAPTSPNIESSDDQR